MFYAIAYKSLAYVSLTYVTLAYVSPHHLLVPNFLVSCLSCLLGLTNNTKRLSLQVMDQPDERHLRMTSSR